MTGTLSLRHDKQGESHRGNKEIRALKHTRTTFHEHADNNGTRRIKPDSDLCGSRGCQLVRVYPSRCQAVPGDALASASCKGDLPDCNCEPVLEESVPGRACRVRSVSNNPSLLTGTSGSKDLPSSDALFSPGRGDVLLAEPCRCWNPAASSLASELANSGKTRSKRKRCRS
jgi:hypothetical protein